MCHEWPHQNNQKNHVTFQNHHFRHNHGVLTSLKLVDEHTMMVRSRVNYKSTSTCKRATNLPVTDNFYVVFVCVVDLDVGGLPIAVCAGVPVR